MRRLFVLHSSRLLCDCLVDCLRHSDLDARAVDPAQPGFLDHLELSQGDILVLDLQLPNQLALATIRSLRTRDHGVKVLLVVSDSLQLLLDCIAAGVDGCVLERSSLSELGLAIDSVMRGEVYCSAEFAKQLLSCMTKGARPAMWSVPRSAVSARLTVREREILELIAQRKCNKQIAKDLDVSLYTVKNHVHNILEKLNVGSRVEAVDLTQHGQLLTNK